MRYGTKDRANVADLKAFARMVSVARQNATTEREKLIAENMLLVVAVAQRFAKVRMHSQRVTDEMIQDGLIGLTKAADGFDASLGFKFSTYAWHSIWNVIQVGAVKARKAMYTARDERDRAMIQSKLIDDPTERYAEIEEAEALCRKAMHGLPDRTKQMIRQRFREDAYYHEIGKRHGVVGERAREVIKEGLRLARKNLVA